MHRGHPHGRALCAEVRRHVGRGVVGLGRSTGCAAHRVVGGCGVDGGSACRDASCVGLRSERNSRQYAYGATVGFLSRGHW